MLRLFTLLVWITCLSACSKTAVTPVQLPVTTPAPLPDTTVPKTYLALGDSYTIGAAVAASARYPVQTVQQLRGAGIFFNSPEIIAQSGWTTNNLLNALQLQPPLLAQYDLVTLLIGVNNQYQGASKTEYRQQFAQLLNMAIQFAGNRKNRVIVLSIPDYSVTPFASGGNTNQIAQDIDAFNLINKQETDLQQVAYLNVTDASRQAANDPTLIAQDGLHFSGKEYAIWANLLVPFIQLALR